MPRILKDHALTFLLFCVFTVGIFIRPALPVDETRYLTVAWEMWFKKDWVHLSYNFEPYHHKPPLLFWLINMFWSVFGISRWAGTLPAVLSSVAVIFMTEKLANKLFPEDGAIAVRTRFLLLGSLPFLLYGSLIMFDMMMTAWVLGALLFLLSYAEKRNAAAVIGYGLCMGLGVLTKGPVIYVYTLLPALLAPLWVQNKKNSLPVMGAAFLALLVSILPALLWLVQTMEGKDGNFVYWLLWEQTAGRVTGNFSNAHGRPLYFYLPILPAFLLPWILFPAFWRGLRARWDEAKSHQGLRFLALWVVPGFLAFSLISGKQPHYLVPFLPGLIIATAFCLRGVPDVMLKKTVISMFAFFIVAHAVAAKTVLHLYDWRPVAAYVAQHQDKSWAYVRNYNGEIGFLSRMEHTLTSTNLKELPAWFAKNPDGMAIIRYKKPEEVKDYEALFIMPYRVNHYAGVFRKR